jgi:prepilin-type processing-associated H-X9-DG protein
MTWGMSVENTNRQYIVEGALGPYMAKSPGSYKCPADKVPAMNGPRVGSYSMNGFVGGRVEMGSKHGRDPAIGANEGVYGFDGYYCYLKDGDTARPGAGNLIVFVCECPDSLNDELFGVHMPASTVWPGGTSDWDDVPSATHSSGGNFSFGDGHVEHHKWVDPQTKSTVLKQTTCPGSYQTSAHYHQWFQTRASAPR